MNITQRLKNHSHYIYFRVYLRIRHNHYVPMSCLSFKRRKKWLKKMKFICALPHAQYKIIFVSPLPHKIMPILGKPLLCLWMTKIAVERISKRIKQIQVRSVPRRCGCCCSSSRRCVCHGQNKLIIMMMISVTNFIACTTVTAT